MNEALINKLKFFRCILMLDRKFKFIAESYDFTIRFYRFDSTTLNYSKYNLDFNNLINTSTYKKNHI